MPASLANRPTQAKERLEWATGPEFARGKRKNPRTLDSSFAVERHSQQYRGQTYIFPSRMVPSTLISYIFLSRVPMNSGCDGCLVSTWKTSVSSGTSLKTCV